jgi:heme exporter protein CcmD
MSLFSAEFWSMGGYAPYIWPSYLIVGFALLALTLQSLQKWHSLKKKLTLMETLKNQGKN